MNARTRRKRQMLRERRRDSRSHSPICNCQQCTGTVFFIPTGYDMYLIHRYGRG